MRDRPELVARILVACVTVAALASVALASATPLALQPGPDAQEYADSALRLVHGLGFVTFIHGPFAEPPRYPPGLPLVLAPFARVGTFPINVQFAARLLALVYVLSMVGAAWALAGSWAALVAGIVVLVSPFARQSATLVLSDGLVGTLSVLMLPVLHRRTIAGDRLGGALMGFASIVRLIAGVGLVAALVAGPRGAWRRTLIWALPFLIGLGLLQWSLFGSPLVTGYDYWSVGFRETFGLGNLFGSHVAHEGPFVFGDLLRGHLMGFVCPCGVGGSMGQLSNFWFYLAVLAGGFWVVAPPLLPLLGLWWAGRRWRDPVARYAVVLTVLSVLVFGFYNYQAVRFLTGPLSVLAVLGSVSVAKALTGLVDRATSRRAAA